MVRSRPEAMALTPVNAAFVTPAAAAAGSRSSWFAGGLLALPFAGILLATAATAQTTASTRALVILPTASIAQTFTDNYLLSATDPAADAITRVTVGVAINANAGPVRGFFDYAMSGLIHARHSDRNTLLNSLSTAFAADLVPGRARLDVSGTVSRSAVSAFGAQPGLDGGVQRNSTELRRLKVAPSVLGPLGGDFRYSANLALEATDARDSVVGDSTSATLGMRLEPYKSGRFGWSVDGTVLRSNFKAGRATSDDRISATARWRLDSIDTEVTGSGGVELSDMTTASRQRFNNWGLGATWTPSPRTTLAAQYDDRFFGPSRRLSFDHRTALTSWHLGKSRSLSTSGGEGELGGRSTAFDLLFAQFASALPDPVKRTEFVNAYLLSQGIAPSATPGFLRASVLVQDLDEASVAFRGPRDTAVLSWRRSRSMRLGVQPGVADDLSVSNEVNLQGLLLDLSHRLTPQSSAGLVLSRQHGRGLIASQNNLQRKLTLRYTLRPSANSDVNLGFSRTLVDSFPAPYDESSLVVTLGYRF